MDYPSAGAEKRLGADNNNTKMVCTVIAYKKYNTSFGKLKIQEA